MDIYKCSSIRLLYIFLEWFYTLTQKIFRGGGRLRPIEHLLEEFVRGHLGVVGVVGEVAPGPLQLHGQHSRHFDSC